MAHINTSHMEPGVQIPVNRQSNPPRGASQSQYPPARPSNQPVYNNNVRGDHAQRRADPRPQYTPPQPINTTQSQPKYTAPQPPSRNNNNNPGNFNPSSSGGGNAYRPSNGRQQQQQQPTPRQQNGYRPPQQNSGYPPPSQNGQRNMNTNASMPHARPTPTHPQMGRQTSNSDASTSLLRNGHTPARDSQSQHPVTPSDISFESAGDRNSQTALNPKEEKPQTFIGRIVQLLETEYNFRDAYTASLNVWISLWILLFSILIFVTAFASNGWAEAKFISTEVTRRFGLWEMCHSVTGCNAIKSGDVGGGYHASQAFAVLSLVSLLAAIIMFILYIFFPDMEKRTEVMHAALVTRISAAFCLLLTFAIYGDNWYKPRYSSPDYDRKLRYSYGLTIFTWLLEMTASIFIGLEVYNKQHEHMALTSISQLEELASQQAAEEECRSQAMQGQSWGEYDGNSSRASDWQEKPNTKRQSGNGWGELPDRHSKPPRPWQEMPDKSQQKSWEDLDRNRNRNSHPVKYTTDSGGFENVSLDNGGRDGGGGRPVQEGKMAGRQAGRRAQQHSQPPQQRGSHGRQPETDHMRQGEQRHANTSHSYQMPPSTGTAAYRLPEPTSI